MQVAKSIKGINLQTPQFQTEAEQINAQLRKLTINELALKMKLSPKLAEQTFENIRQFGINSSVMGAAILSYSGDVYKGLKAESFTQSQITYAQDHVFILSGMYGILRPLDTIHPYRLEMGLGLKVGKANNLYQFWGDRLAKTILTAHQKPIVNLLSEEYFSAVSPFLDPTTILHIHFREEVGGKLQLKSAFAKKARGLMCRYGIENKITKQEQLKKFNVEGYQFQAALSDQSNWYFTR